jgi:glycosyltransferase involved in cell wall biosynthesis
MSHRLPHITYVIDDLGHGGAQRQLYYAVRALAGAGDLSVVVLSDVVDPYAARIRELGVRVEVISRRTGLDAGRVLALARKFDELETGIAHAMLDASNGYTFLAARMRRIPAVLSLRSDRLQATGSRARTLGWMMRNSPAVTVNSNAGRDYLVNRLGIRAKRVCLVPNIVEVPPAANHPATVPPVIGAVGRLVEMKRFDSILNALAIVRRAVPAARIVLVGDGPARPGLEDLARRGDIADAVQFTGAVDDAAPHIMTFGCLVVASTHEGLPNAALEALARGVPVVTVPAGDLPRVVKDGVTGIMARDASAPALAEGIVRALTSPALRESAAREGPRLMREEFSPARARAQLVELYSRLARQ